MYTVSVVSEKTAQQEDRKSGAAGAAAKERLNTKMSEITAKTPWASHLGDVPIHLDYFDGSMFEAVEKIAAQYPDNVAFDFMGSSTTYRRLVQQVAATSEMTNGVISSETKAENQTTTNQPKIDYLWANTQTATGENPNVTFQFAHKMCKLTLKLVQGNDVTISQVTKYSLSGLVLEGTFDTTNGTAAAKTDGASTQDLEMEVSGVTSDSEYSLILYPQTITNGVTLSVTCNNLTYSCPLKVNNGDLSAVAAGNNYSFTVTVSKKGLTITNSTITDWIAVSGDAGTAYPG